MKYVLLSLLLCLNLFAGPKKLNKQRLNIIGNIIDKRFININRLKGHAKVKLEIDKNGIANYKLIEKSKNEKFDKIVSDFINKENGKFYMKNLNKRSNTIHIDFKGK